MDPQDLGSLGPPETSGLQDPWKIPSELSEPKQLETLKLTHKHKTILNYITEQSQTKTKNCVYLSEVSLFIELLTIITRGKSLPLPPSSYVTVINRNDNQRLIGYTWIEENSRFSYVTVCENIHKITRICFRYSKVNKILLLHSSN